MPLYDVSWSELLPVFKETYHIWSPGLSPEKYRQYLKLQLTHPWSRKNYRYVVHRDNERIVSSCKLYTLTLQSRGRSFKFGGIGAVFTQPNARGRGYAAALIEQIIMETRKDEFEGLILFSDIGSRFYEPFGFEEMGSAEFFVYLPRVPAPQVTFLSDDRGIDHFMMKEAGETFEAESAPFDRKHIPIVSSMYAKWLRAQPFGFQRSHDYWDFKLARERFLNANSRLSWPMLMLTIVYQDGFPVGYATTEMGGATMRILEVVGRPDSRLAVWKALLLRAAELKVARLRGWEGIARDFQPSFNLRKILNSDAVRCVYPPFVDGVVNYAERSWGRAMILSYHADSEHFANHQPCPLLELDHL